MEHTGLSIVEGRYTYDLPFVRELLEQELEEGGKMPSRDARDFYDHCPYLYPLAWSMTALEDSGITAQMIVTKVHSELKRLTNGEGYEDTIGTTSPDCYWVQDDCITRPSGKPFSTDPLSPIKPIIIAPHISTNNSTNTLRISTNNSTNTLDEAWDAVDV